MSRIVEHINAVKHLLAAVAGTPTHGKVLEIQAKSLAGAIASATFSLADAAAAAEALKGLPSQQHMELAALVADRVAAPKASVSQRAGLQDYTNAVHYFTADAWQDLEDKNIEPRAKMEKLIVACISVGMRNPNELTCQKLAGLCLLLSDGKRQVLQMPGSTKLEHVRMFKTKFKSCLARLRPCLPNPKKPPLKACKRRGWSFSKSILSGFLLPFLWTLHLRRCRLRSRTCMKSRARFQ